MDASRARKGDGEGEVNMVKVLYSMYENRMKKLVETVLREGEMRGRIELVNLLRVPCM
jgi:hypothetical protein